MISGFRKIAANIGPSLARMMVGTGGVGKTKAIYTGYQSYSASQKDKDAKVISHVSSGSPGITRSQAAALRRILMG